MKLTTAEQMRTLDQKAIRERGIPSLDLMERAAQGVAEAAWSCMTGKKEKVTSFCGSGNNGGDGIAAARLLRLRGCRVRVFLAGSYEKLTPDAMEQVRLLSECGVELEVFDPEDPDQRAWARESSVIIDALFGVGLCREIDGSSLYAAAIDLMNACPGAVIAADIASGVEADTGRILGRAVRANRTVTFSFMKIGQAVGQGALCAGEVEVQDIGIPRDLRQELVCRAQTVEGSYVRQVLPPRKPDGHKGDFGKVLVVGGAIGFSGAPYLTAASAARSGCGLVYLGIPESLWAVEAAKCVSEMPFPLPGKLGAPCLGMRALPDLREKLKNCDVLALGPGMGREEDTGELVRSVLSETEKPVVLDADGINALEGHIDILDGRRGRVTILTPHDGEFARVGGDLSHGDRVRAAREFAAAHGCILVLKGHRTVTAVPEGNVLVNTTGDSGLAKGGSGDILTGLIAGLLAQGATPVQAAAAGVWLHGRAGELASRARSAYASVPETVLEKLGEAFLDLIGSEEQ